MPLLCKRGGDVVFRHNRLRDILAETCRRAYFSVQVEAGCNLTPDHSHSRPADVLISNWALEKTAACDISVTSPLIMSEAGITAGAAAQATEHEANDVKCSELGWLCIPLVVESYGAWGKEAMESFSSLASRLAITSSRPKSAILSELGGVISPSNMDILGVPIGDCVHCSRFIAEKCATPKTLLKALVDVSAVDLHVAFSILRMCGSYCKLVHLARATPPSHCADYLKLFDEEVRLCFTTCIAVDVPDLSWQQAQPSPSLGGLGFRSLALHSSAAFIASFASSGFCSPDKIHMLQAVTRFNAQVHPLESTTAEAVLACPPLQRALSKKLDNHAFQSLLSSSSQISATPSTGLDLHLDSAECQVALRWWLGLYTSGGSPCPLCPDTALDPLSHHAATCRHGGDVVARHNRLRDIFANFCRRAHLSVQVEVGYGLARDHINSRPADILVQGWDRGKPAAFDVTVTSPLTPVSLNNASASVGAAAYAAECRKHAANDTRCQELGWLCIPLAVETYSNWGKEAQSVFSRLSSLLSISQAIPKPKMLSEIYSRLNMSLVRSVARAIMGREAVQGARLLSVAAPRASSWLSVVPSPGLGLHLESNEYQMAIRWCLGLDTSGWSMCPFCPNIALDPLGHHAVTCRHGGYVVIRDEVFDLCRCAHPKCECGEMLWSHQRPCPHQACILITGWDRGKPVALDLTITSPLCSVILSESCHQAGVAALAAKARKLHLNGPKCQELGWSCIPLDVETYGNWGKEAHDTFSRLASYLAIHQFSPKSAVVAEIYGQLNIPCVVSAYVIKIIIIVVIIIAQAAEERKPNDAKCEDLGWTCIPLAVKSYGNWGKEACDVFNRLASLLAFGHSSTKPRFLTEIYSHLNMSLTRSAAKAIMVGY
ncbi:hypothetical protein EMCRGX_G004448 [Ephydatia muelleri]